MTRVVVQRGQGSSGSTQSRSASSALSVAPNQPSSGTVSTSSNVEEDVKNESREPDSAACNDSASVSVDPHGKAKGLLFPEDGNDKGKEAIVPLVDGDSETSRKQQAAKAIVSDQKKIVVQSEDVGAQKLHSDGKSGGNSQETMDEASGLQIKLNLPSSPFQTNVDEIASSSSSSSKLADTTPCSSSLTPSGLTPAISRRTVLGSSLIPGVRASVGSSRKNWKSVKSSKSPPQNSRSSSPRSYMETDGYNSADEQNPWALPSLRSFEDNDDRERQFEIEIRRAKGLEVRRMAEDGNCLFRAVSDQVYGDAEMHGETRQMCIDYMEKERDHFSQFVTESFSTYCKRKRRDKIFGNNLEIQAMAEMYNRPIHIFSYGTEPKNIFQRNYETDMPPIRLSYHRGNHYNSLFDPLRPTVGAGLGFGSLHGANVDRDKVKAAIKAQQDLQIDKALVAEGRLYSDMELTEQEMERMVIETSRAEFLAEEYGYQLGCEESSTSAAGSSSSRSETYDNQGKSTRQMASATSLGSNALETITPNMRMMLSMGFSYFRVMEAYNVFGDDINNMLCYLLEVEAGGMFDDSNYRMKGKAAER